MNNAFNWVLGVIAAMAISLASFGLAQAQSQTQGEGDQFSQIKLTDAQVTGYLASTKQLSKVTEKVEAAGEKPDPKIREELEAIAKQHGFKSYSELEDVIMNISFVLSGFDDEGNFTDPRESLKAELEQVKSDDSIKAKEKAEMIAEIEEALKNTPSLKYPENATLVKKHLKALDQVLVAPESPDGQQDEKAGDDKPKQ